MENSIETICSISLHIYYNKNFYFYQIIISGCVLLLSFDKMFIRNAAVARCRTTLEIFSFALGISSFNLLRFPVSPVSTSRSFYALTISYIYIITKNFEKINYNSYCPKSNLTSQYKFFLSRLS